MSQKNMVSLDINENLISSMVENQLKIAMSEALGGKDEIMNRVVESVLYQKVNKDGKVSSYLNENKYSWIEFAVTKQLQELTRKLLQEEVEKQSSKIKDCLVASLQTKKGANKFAEAILGAFNDTLSSNWRAEFNISLNNKE